MDNRMKTITLTGKVEFQRKKDIFEAERNRRMLAYNHAMKRLVCNA